MDAAPEKSFRKELLTGTESCLYFSCHVRFCFTKSFNNASPVAASNVTMARKSFEDEVTNPYVPDSDFAVSTRTSKSDFCESWSGIWNLGISQLMLTLPLSFLFFYLYASSKFAHTYLANMRWTSGVIKTHINI